MIPQEVKEAQVIFVNHSGGKDSQAMFAALVRQGLGSKLVVVHSDLGEMEWEPMKPFIETNCLGRGVHVVEPEIGFFELCRKYDRLPSGLARFCTSELKTRPIGKWIHDYCAKHGITKAVNAIGIRAEESPARAKKSPLTRSKLSRVKKGLEITEWFPIFDYKLNDVWNEIRMLGQTPHPIYSQGFSRLSCVFCVFGRVGEHQLAAKRRPELFQKMVKLERDLGKTIRLKQRNKVKYNKYLDEYITA
jgi:DNA sulfur modification protein DndC